jgi:hypothetical protein
VVAARPWTSCTTWAAAINPAIDKGQIEGAYIQGMGWLTMEECIWDRNGKLLTHGPSTYKIPVAGDIPEHFKVSLFDGENVKPTPYRSKAVGEPPLMLALSTFFAVRDAVSAIGRAQGSGRSGGAGHARAHPAGLRAGPGRAGVSLTVSYGFAFERRTRRKAEDSAGARQGEATRSCV